ncbi:MAG TPA: hypothetical protein VNJ08_16610 [Bacteriovoracaceae bacterium]|nr:hypothetical protein [Bacteriovoracaceae bacterium]
MSNPHLSAVPVILTSATADVESIQEIGKFHACLKKPVDLDVLLEAVRKFSN